MGLPEKLRGIPGGGGIDLPVSERMPPGAGGAPGAPTGAPLVGAPLVGAPLVGAPLVGAVCGAEPAGRGITEAGAPAEEAAGARAPGPTGGVDGRGEATGRLPAVALPGRLLDEMMRDPAGPPEAGGRGPGAIGPDSAADGRGAPSAGRFSTGLDGVGATGSGDEGATGAAGADVASAATDGALTSGAVGDSTAAGRSDDSTRTPDACSSGAVADTASTVVGVTALPLAGAIGGSGERSATTGGMATSTGGAASATDFLPPLTGLAGSSGWTSRRSPSASALRRTRSAWASSMLEE